MVSAREKPKCGQIPKKNRNDNLDLSRVFDDFLLGWGVGGREKLCLYIILIKILKANNLDTHINSYTYEEWPVINIFVYGLTWGSGQLCGLTCKWNPDTVIFPDIGCSQLKDTDLSFWHFITIYLLCQQYLFFIQLQKGKLLVFIQSIKLVEWGLLHLMFLDSLLADLSDNPIVLPPYQTRSRSKKFSKEKWQTQMDLIIHNWGKFTSSHSSW